MNIIPTGIVARFSPAEWLNPCLTGGLTGPNYLKEISSIFRPIHKSDRVLLWNRDVIMCWL